MKNSVKKLVKISPIVLGLGFLVWGLVINILSKDDQRDLFTDLYYFIPLLGGIAQYISSKGWGGMKSSLGKSFRFFSVALIAESVGLLIYSIYFRIRQEELAYPSVGDLIFVIGIVSFVLGAYWLLRVIAPIRKQLMKPWWHIVATLVLLAGVLAIVWVEFLNVGVADDRGKMTIVFNVLYPTTQLLYLGLCLLALIKVKATAGGRMFMPVLWLLVSMCVLYVADFVFLRQSYNETWVAAGISDMLYVLAYTMIVWSLYNFGAVRAKIVGSKGDR